MAAKTKRLSSRALAAGMCLAGCLVAPVSDAGDGTALVSAAWERYRSVRSEREEADILIAPATRPEPFSRREAERLLRDGADGVIHKRAVRHVLYAKDGRDKLHLLFSLPPEDAGLGFLVWRGAAGAPDEMYLFMPGYRGVRRVPLSDSKRLAGTDLLYEDVRALLGERTSLFSYETLPAEQVDGHACDAVVARPRPEVSTAYSRRKMWIDKELQVPRKVEYYDGDELWKVLRSSEIGEVMPGVYRAALTEMRDLRAGRATLLLATKRSVGIEIPAEVFTQDYLEHPGRD